MLTRTDKILRNNPTRTKIIKSRNRFGSQNRKRVKITLQDQHGKRYDYYIFVERVNVLIGHSVKRKIVGYRFEKRGVSSDNIEVIKGIPFFRTPQNLASSIIALKNNGKTIKGKILKAAFVGGGSTGPATDEGLPDNDE